jgi:hypothetical protein
MESSLPSSGAMQPARWWQASLKRMDRWIRSLRRLGAFGGFDPIRLRGENMTKSYRVVTRGVDGAIRIRDYDKQESLMRLHTQIGVDDSSTDLSLRGLPLFRGLIGPMPEGKHVVRYESPEVFETLTKEWASISQSRRSRRRRQQDAEPIQETSTPQA